MIPLKFRTACRAAFVAVICSLFFSSSVTMAASLSESDAESVVLRYLDALSQGDTLTIKQLLGGDNLINNLELLNNPSYSSMLSKMYSNADYGVVGVRNVDDRYIDVDTHITLSPQEVLTPTFRISEGEEGSLKIMEEINASDERS